MLYLDRGVGHTGESFIYSTLEIWRKKWLPTPVFLPGESHGRRNLTSYSPWGVTKCRTQLSTLKISVSQCVKIILQKKFFLIFQFYFFLILFYF